MQSLAGSQALLVSSGISTGISTNVFINDLDDGTVLLPVLQIAQHWEKLSTCCMAGQLIRGTWTAWGNGLTGTWGLKQWKQIQIPASGMEWPLTTQTGWSQISGKLLCRKKLEVQVDKFTSISSMSLDHRSPGGFSLGCILVIASWEKLSFPLFGTCEPSL